MPRPKDQTKPQLTDELLDELLECSWKPYQPSVSHQVCRELLQWALLERMQGVVPPIDALREKFAFFWNQIWGTRPKEGQLYWSVIGLAASVARRIYEFLLRYEVHSPLRRYVLRLPSGIVRGRSAIVRRQLARSVGPPMALDFLDRIPRQYLQPSARALARWLAMRKKCDEVGLGLVHLPLLLGSPWTEAELNEPLARTSLDSILKAVAVPAPYARPGYHCRGCPAPCKEIFRGSNDSSGTRWNTALLD